MAQNVTVAGASYSDVPSVVLPKTGGGSAEFIDTTISSNAATASDILSGKLAWVNGTLIEGTGTSGGGVGAVTQDANGYVVLDNGEPYSQDINITDNGTYNVAGYGHAIVSVSGGSPTISSLTVTPTTSQQTFNSSSVDGYKPVVVNAMPSGSVTAPSTISGTSATVSTGTNTLTLSKTVSVTPSVTTAGYVSSGTTGNSNVSLTASVTTQAAQTIYPSTSDQTINSGRYLTGTQTIKGVAVSNTLTADNIKSGVTITIGDSADADRITSVTGTYSGGGTSKNTQVIQATTRVQSTSLAKASGELTVSKTGTYHVYWSTMRTNTSSGYTWGSQLYVGGSAYGSENTSGWSNNVQNIHLQNVSLTANQKIQVYSRGRSGSYYSYVPTLVIVEA